LTHTRDEKGTRKLTVDIAEHRFPKEAVPDWFWWYEVTISESHFLSLLKLPSSFLGKVWFLQTEFRQTVRTLGGHIAEHGMIFSGCTFRHPLHIAKCTIEKLSFGENCHFEQGIHIVGGSVEEGGLSFRSTRISGPFVIEGTLIRSNLQSPFPVSFEDVGFSRSFIEFSVIPKCNFIGCAWDRVRESSHIKHPIKSFDGRVRTLDRYRPGTQEEQFRQMRRHLSTTSKTYWANEFYLSETETHRQQLPKRIDWLFLTIYKYLSYYNVRPIRPLGWLAFLLLVLPFFHMYGGFEVHRPRDRFVERINYELFHSKDTQSLTLASPRDVIRDWLVSLNFAVKSMVLRTGTEYEPLQMSSVWAQTIGMIAGPSLVLLFAFSVRRRFRGPTGID
jgi:hypothetical protein